MICHQSTTKSKNINGTRKNNPIIPHIMPKNSNKKKKKIKNLNKILSIVKNNLMKKLKHHTIKSIINSKKFLHFLIFDEDETESIIVSISIFSILDFLPKRSINQL
ncbi:MAG: hypothetical protein ACOZBL_04540 [Patescibacteria group bacterium]